MGNIRRELAVGSFDEDKVVRFQHVRWVWDSYLRLEANTIRDKFMGPRIRHENKGGVHKTIADKTVNNMCADL